VPLTSVVEGHLGLEQALPAEGKLLISDQELGGLRLVERRIAKRFRVDWGIRISATGADGARFVETGLLRDLSTRGAYAYLISRLEIGSTVEVLIRLPLNREGWISYPAKVLRIDSAASELGTAFIFDTARPVFVANEYI
jgi:hypothetical protein